MGVNRRELVFAGTNAFSHVLPPKARGIGKEEHGGSPPKCDRVDGWKSIAGYLDRDVTTVIRWAKFHGLPVNRVPEGSPRRAVTLSELAAVVSLSPFYLARAFDREIGVPPHAYLEGVRIRKAREFLDRGSDLVSTALAVGYSDQSHFTRRFKRYLGITPGQYCRESKIRQDW